MGFFSGCLPCLPFPGFPIFFFFLSPIFLIHCSCSAFSLRLFLLSVLCLLLLSFLLLLLLFFLLLLFLPWLLLPYLPSVRLPVPSVVRLPISLASLLASVVSFLPLHFIGSLRSLPAFLLLSLPVFLSDRFLLSDSGFRHLCFSFRPLIHCSCHTPGPPPPPFSFISISSFAAPALRLSSTPVCLSCRFSLDGTSFHFLRCSCPILSPPPPHPFSVVSIISFAIPALSLVLPPHFSLLSSLVPPFPTCRLYLLFLDLLFLLSSPRIFSPLFSFLLVLALLLLLFLASAGYPPRFVFACYLLPLYVDPLLFPITYDNSVSESVVFPSIANSDFFGPCDFFFLFFLRCFCLTLITWLVVFGFTRRLTHVSLTFLIAVSCFEKRSLDCFHLL